MQAQDAPRRLGTVVDLETKWRGCRRVVFGAVNLHANVGRLGKNVADAAVLHRPDGAERVFLTGRKLVRLAVERMDDHRSLQAGSG